MPIYDYTCESCETAFEHLARRIDEAAPPCPKCGAKKTVKGLTVPAVGGGTAKARASGGKSLPMGGGGCCPCGKGAGACSRG
jgi:putative FmdB family regulatory protein